MIQANPGLRSFHILYLTEEIMQALLELPRLRKLQISASNISNKELALLIESSRNLKHFYMLRDFLTKENRHLVFRAIAQHPSLTHLCLPGYQPPIGPILEQNTHLTYVALNQQQYSHDILRGFVRDYPNITFAFPSIRTIKVNSDITPEKCADRTILKFTRNKIPSFLVETPLPQITTVDIEYLEQDDMDDLITFFNLNPQIENVTIGCIFSSDIRAFMASLCNIVSLEMPWRSGMMSMLSGHDTLESLTIHGFGDHGDEVDMFEFVKSIPHLYHINIEQRHPNDVKAKHFCQMRKFNHKTYNPTLTHRLLRLVSEN